MVSREQIQGQWTEVKGRLREHWGQLTENDLQRAKGSAEQLVGVVQEKTGATRNEVEHFLDGIFNERTRAQLEETAQHYSEAAQQAANEAAEYMRDQYQRAAAASGDFASKISHSVRSRPTESIAIAFGLGIAAGALLFFGKRTR